MYSFFQEALAWKAQLTWLGFCHNCAREHWSKLCNNTPHTIAIIWMWGLAHPKRDHGFGWTSHITWWWILWLSSIRPFFHQVFASPCGHYSYVALKQHELPRPKKLEPIWETKAPILPLGILEPCTPKHPHNHKLVCDNLSCLLLS